MRRKGIFGSADRPDMDVVHGLDTRHGLHRLFHLVDADTHGNAVERQTQAVARQRPDRCHDHGGNDKPDDGVYDRPSRPRDHDTRHQHPHRHQRIGGHMQISPFHVQVFVLILHEKPGRKAVDHNPDAGRPGDGSALDGCRMQHPPHALGNDDPHGDEQDHGVEQRNEHRALLIAVGIPGRSMGLCKAESQHGQQQARHVGKVVPGI